MYKFVKSESNSIRLEGEKEDEIQAIDYTSTEQSTKISIVFNRMDKSKLSSLFKIIANKEDNVNVKMELKKEYYLSIKSDKATVYRMIDSLTQQGIIPDFFKSRLNVLNVLNAVDEVRHQSELYNKKMNDTFAELMTAIKTAKPKDQVGTISIGCGTTFGKNSFFEARNVTNISMPEEFRKRLEDEGKSIPSPNRDYCNNATIPDGACVVIDGSKITSDDVVSNGTSGFK